MPEDPVVLGERATDGIVELERAVGKRLRSAQPVAMTLAKGRSPVREGEVLTLVLTSEGVVAYRRQLHGRSAGLSDIQRQLAGAQAAMDRVEAQSTDMTSPPLSAHEQMILGDTGLVTARDVTSSALERSRIELEMMLQESLTLEQAAKVLQVTPSRLRQLLSPRARRLYGIKEGRGWRIPKFQIRGRKLVRGIDQALPHIRPDAHPLSVVTWFSTPHEDLVVGDDETPVTPIAWLEAGNPPQLVAELAEEI